eukprot:m.1256730 g.1256730  ORF g.1256730 m.1256730 type:complete len:260 (+) comp24712_c0_seq21:706-1485(+)
MHVRLVPAGVASKSTLTSTNGTASMLSDDWARIVSLLLGAGARTCAVDGTLRTPLHAMAVQRSCFDAVAEALLRDGSAEVPDGLHQCDKNGMTPLYAAVRSRNDAAVLHLLRAGAADYYLCRDEMAYGQPQRIRWVQAMELCTHAKHERQSSAIDLLLAAGWDMHMQDNPPPNRHPFRPAREYELHDKESLQNRCRKVLRRSLGSWGMTGVDALPLNDQCKAVLCRGYARLVIPQARYHALVRLRSQTPVQLVTQQLCA